MSRDVTAIRLSGTAYFLRNGRVVQAQEGDDLVIDEGRFLGRREIDPGTALLYLQRGLATPCAFAPEVTDDLDKTLEEYSRV